MNAIPEKFLPIGTVVLLKGAKKRIMISGFVVISKDDNKIWDYCGCAYPEGIITLEQTCLFNHDQIGKIFHMGLLDDDEQKELQKELQNIMESPDNYLNKNKDN